MKMKKWLSMIALGTCMALAAGCGGDDGAKKDASVYPDKPINLIVTHAAGGDTDCPSSFSSRRARRRAL